MSRRTRDVRLGWRRRIRRWWRHSRRNHVVVRGVYRGGASTLLTLAAIAALALGVALWVAGNDVRRMSGTAAATIVSTRTQAASGFEQSPAGLWIRYTYAVGGTVYPGEDFERWSSVATYEPKVCFDPARPADHRLVPGRKVCGVTP